MMKAKLNVHKMQIQKTGRGTACRAHAKMLSETKMYNIFILLVKLFSWKADEMDNDKRLLIFLKVPGGMNRLVSPWMN